MTHALLATPFVLICERGRANAHVFFFFFKNFDRLYEGGVVAVACTTSKERVQEPVRAKATEEQTDLKSTNSDFLAETRAQNYHTTGRNARMNLSIDSRTKDDTVRSKSTISACQIR